MGEVLTLERVVYNNRPGHISVDGVDSGVSSVRHEVRFRLPNEAKSENSLFSYEIATDSGVIITKNNVSKTDFTEFLSEGEFTITTWINLAYNTRVITRFTSKPQSIIDVRVARTGMSYGTSSTIHNFAANINLCITDENPSFNNSFSANAYAPHGPITEGTISNSMFQGYFHGFYLTIAGSGSPSYQINFINCIIRWDNYGSLENASLNFNNCYVKEINTGTFTNSYVVIENGSGTFKGSLNNSILLSFQETNLTNNSFNASLLIGPGFTGIPINVTGSYMTNGYAPFINVSFNYAGLKSSYVNNDWNFSEPNLFPWRTQFAIEHYPVFQFILNANFNFSTTPAWFDLLNVFQGVVTGSVNFLAVGETPYFTDANNMIPINGTTQAVNNIIFQPVQFEALLPSSQNNLWVSGELDYDLNDGVDYYANYLALETAPDDGVAAKISEMELKNNPSSDTTFSNNFYTPIETDNGNFKLSFQDIYEALP